MSEKISRYDPVYFVGPAKEEKRQTDAMSTQVGGSHYKDLAIQPIEFITKNNLGFCEGNIIKYATRHKSKNGAEDIRKIIHYARLILKLQYGID